jgi:hypothetical protein
VLPPLLAGQVPPAELDRARLPTARLRLDELGRVEAYSGGLREGLRWEWWRAWAAPPYHHRIEILSGVWPSAVHYQHRQNGYRQMDASGWVPYPHPDVSPGFRRRATEAGREEYTPYLRGYRLGGPAAMGLCEVLEVCQRERLPAALLLMPEGPVFRSWYPPGAWEQVSAFLGGLSRRYAVPVINARAWMAEEDFADSHHLLPAAAAAFSGRLGREALVPLLAGAVPSRSRDEGTIETSDMAPCADTTHPCRGLMR